VFGLQEEVRTPIENCIDDFFTRKDLTVRLREFISGGKMIRGTLLIFSFRMFAAQAPSWLVQMAAALELIHSSLLIHDDIMDRDTLRRGRKTVFHQYREIGEREGLKEPSHIGLGFGICAGDIGFFLAYELLADSPAPCDVRANILSFWSGELAAVGLAQMQDLYLSAGRRTVTEAEILDMYRYKTARYSFSLPLASGAIAAGAPQAAASGLSKLGESLGVIFQIKDDQIGLFGEQGETGKPVGSDIKEKKKTLFSLYLSQIEDHAARETVETIYAGADISVSDIQALERIAREFGVTRRIEEKLGQLEKRAVRQIRNLPVSSQGKDMLRGILSYNLERST
jgi:geranylgeranyl diphosphate synthase type I